MLTTALVAVLSSAVSTAINLVPQPVKVTPGSGSFTLDASTRITAPPSLRAVAERFRDDLRPGTGLPLTIGAGGKAIVLTLDGKLAASLGEEGYRLRVTADRVDVRAARPAGVFYGLQTFRQLLPPENFRRALVGSTVWKAPAVEIEDRPRFSWRGSHLDVARHFQPKEAVLKHLDLMALHKLNVFHWHLTEDQGWRLEIKKYPRLTEVGAWRKDSALGPPPPRDKLGKRAWRFKGKPHGGFYTQDQAREVVRYAADRFITVVPEIEMPGHAKAAIAAYPQLGNSGKPIEVETAWGVFTEIFSPTDETLRFLEDVLSEVLEIFPSRFIHIGGDEVPKDEWKRSPVAQARMKSLGLKNEEELQSWFIKQIGAWLASRGRRLVGWEEILHGGLAPGATVMAWESEKPAIEAAKLGHDAIIATKVAYLDYLQSTDPREPVGIGGDLPLEKVYTFDPIPGELPRELQARILGGQAQIWTEYMPNAKHVEYMAWPRLSAVAEKLWSPREGRDFADYKMRLAKAHLARLGYLDVAYRPLDGPLPTALSIP
jgi:hexosaminidase